MTGVPAVPNPRGGILAGDLPHAFGDRFVQRVGATAWTSSTHSLWTGDWDPAIPSTSRSVYTDWLDIPALGETGASVQSVEMTTTYDAAGRPTEVGYHQSMKLY